MPTPKTVKKHKGVRKVVKRRLKNGTTATIYIYGDDKIAATIREKMRSGTHS